MDVFQAAAEANLSSRGQDPLAPSFDHRRQSIAAQVWPVLAAEFAAAHLITLATHHPHAVRPGLDEPEILSALRTGAGPGDVVADPTAVVAGLVTDPRFGLDVERLDRPAPGDRQSVTSVPTASPPMMRMRSPSRDMS